MIGDGVLFEQSLDDFLDRRLGRDVEVLDGVLGDVKRSPLRLQRSNRSILIGTRSQGQASVRRNID